MIAINAPRLVVLHVMQHPGSSPRHVEFSMNDSFVDRLRQLRSLVPANTHLNLQRDLVIDKVRVRLHSAVWRRKGEPVDVTGSCIVVSSEGIFHCGAKENKTKAKLLTCTFPISRLLELHAERPAGEVFVIRNGVFANDEPAETEAAQWLASLQGAEEQILLHEGSSDFDTIQGNSYRVQRPSPEMAARVLAASI